jgi:hypothetical protein
MVAERIITVDYLAPKTKVFKSFSGEVLEYIAGKASKNLYNRYG